jgi:hypothetical protein
MAYKVMHVHDKDCVMCLNIVEKGESFVIGGQNTLCANCLWIGGCKYVNRSQHDYFTKGF